MLKGNIQLKIIFVVLCSLIFSVLKTQAATLYLNPDQGQYYPGQTFILEARISIGKNEAINAVDGYIKYPKDVLSVSDVSTGNSILTFIAKPEIDQSSGTVSFSGIISNGYTGQIPGNPELANVLLKIVFKVSGNMVGLSQKDPIQISFTQDTKVFLNDGKATLAKLDFRPSSVSISNAVSQQLADVWHQMLKKDTVPPEDFSPEVIQIDNKYYLAFLSQDKDSGINYYQVQESKQKSFDNSKWESTESPYLLQDQSLKSYIYVKAIDKAANVKIAMYIPASLASGIRNQYSNIWFWIIILSGVILLALFCCILLKRLWKSKRNISQ